MYFADIQSVLARGSSAQCFPGCFYESTTICHLPVVNRLYDVDTRGKLYMARDSEPALLCSWFRWVCFVDCTLTQLYIKVRCNLTSTSFLLWSSTHQVCCAPSMPILVVLGVGSGTSYWLRTSWECIWNPASHPKLFFMRFSSWWSDSFVIVW